ncbi:Flagellar biosynthesis protein FlaG [Petrocella atlantisensis]|uniref:Flagellar biosynthesis protein FlaG n=1 Tax=Petrocella atlantisensis TaxID=2173034 RepID=A0A3P7P4Q8_9FIRM|nr:flagellar protein FlaG [Petrocella atlantisensis]VDN48550.1 Flagellar biosynthesis protein FlaG [Petrocella atlantisensis]
MRIDSVGSANSVSTPQNVERVGRTESPAPIQPVKSSGSQNGLAVKQQERIHVEAEVAAIENTKEQEHQVIKAIEKANKHIRTYDRRLEFSIHDATKQIMVKVINTENDSVIREIPSEKVLDMVAHLWEISGILVDEHR